MTIIGFTFNKIMAEKNNPVKGKISITNDVKITKIEDAKMPIAENDKSALTFNYEFSTNYSPEIGTIKVSGEVFWLDETQKNKTLLANYKKESHLPMALKVPIFNTILAKCTMQSIYLSRELNLPTPIRLPRVAPEEKPQTKQKK